MMDDEKTPVVGLITPPPFDYKRIPLPPLPPMTEVSEDKQIVIEWRKWFSEEFDKYIKTNEPDIINQSDLFWDSMAGWGMLIIALLWVPGLWALKVHRYLRK